METEIFLGFEFLIYSRLHKQVGGGFVGKNIQTCFCGTDVYVDADVTMRAHVTVTVRACFAALRQIRSVRRSLSRDALLILLRALVVSKVDYCCSVLAGISGTLLQRLQSVMNTAARLVFSAKRSEYLPRPSASPPT